MDQIAAGNRWLAGVQRTSQAQEIRYVRGESSALMPATIGRTPWENYETAAELQVRFESRDFLISLSDLLIDGVPAVPTEGDQIIETTDDTVYTYEVTPLAVHVPCWEWAEPHRNRYRIHAKQISAAAAES